MCCLKFPILAEEIGNLTSLTMLNLYECSCLTILLQGFGNLTFWLDLDLLDCSSLTTLPHDLETWVLWARYICPNGQAWKHYTRDWKLTSLTTLLFGGVFELDNITQGTSRLWWSLIWRDLHDNITRGFRTSFLRHGLVCGNVQAWQQYLRDLEISILELHLGDCLSFQQD